MADVATEITSDADTGSADNASTEASQTDTASPDAASSATVDSADTAANPGADENAGSLASGAEATETAQAVDKQAQQQKPEDWKRRHDGQFQANQRLSAEKKQLEAQAQQFQRELQELKQQLQGVDLNKVRSWQEHQQKSANPIWHPKHPEHQRFLKAKSKHDFYVGLAQRAPAEQREWINAQYNADLSAEDQRMIQEHLDTGRQELARLQMDPTGYMQERIDKLVDEKIKAFQQETVGSYRQNLEARNTLQQTLTKYPELNKPDVLQRAMQMVGEGRDMTDALRDIRMEMLERRLSGAETHQRSVEERERLLTNNASISRDQAATQTIDVFAEANKIAKARGITNPFDARYMRVVDELRKKHNIKE